MTTMALHQAKAQAHGAKDKLIFAPSPADPAASGPAPAAQFTLAERQSGGRGLRRSDLHPSDPIVQFHAWFADATSATKAPSPSSSAAVATAAEAAAAADVAVAIAHPETCTLSTASLPSGRVSARTVYLKELDARGWVVYSNFGSSRKARDLFGEEAVVATTGATPSNGGGGGGEGQAAEPNFQKITSTTTGTTTTAAATNTVTTTPNPWAALTFWWEPLERQVRVEGRCERLPREESQVYFDTRARGSRVGAWASRQSVVLRPRGGGSSNSNSNSSSNNKGVERREEGEGEGEGEEKKEGKKKDEKKNDDAADDEDEEDDGRAQLEDWVREAEKRFERAGQIPVPEFWGGLRIVPERVEFWQGRVNRLHDRFVYDRVAAAAAAEAEGEEHEAKWTLERLSP